ncbi:MAG: gamma-glutamyl-gamma-aminobutyrate hydrolase family protein [Phycisphaerales bacterium]
MSSHASGLRLLLLQVRDEPSCADHELACIMDHFELDPSRVDRVNVVLEGVPAWERVARADAVIMGGAGDHSVTERYHYDDALEHLTRKIVDESVPLFGSCYGHQFVARTLGGRVMTDHGRAEVGIATIRLTPAGERDPVFGTIGATSFDAIVGHHDLVEELPSGAVELACNELCPNQAFKLEGRLVYGTQFHAEMTPERLIERLETHRHYIPDDNEFDGLKGSLRPTPVTARILGRFLETVAGSLGV